MPNPPHDEVARDSGAGERGVEHSVSLLAAQRFARARLGPASAELLGDVAVGEAVRARIGKGLAVEDAVLAEVFGRAGKERELAGEFFGYLLGDVVALRTLLPARSAGLQRLLDSGDFVQSVLGDLWPALGTLEFRTKGQFLALLAQRFQWKVADRQKGLECQRRREDLRVEVALEGLGVATGEMGPLSEIASQEEAARLAGAISRMGGRDRELLRLHLQGRSVEAIAAEVHLGIDAARKALQRARERVKTMI